MRPIDKFLLNEQRKQLKDSEKPKEEKIQVVKITDFDAIEKVLACRQGQFYERVIKLAIRHSAPKSLVTNLSIRRMRDLKMPKAEIAEAERIRWGIHHQAHRMYIAERKGNHEQQLKARAKVRKLEKIFMNKFVKRL